jgi:hypothetical protein
MTHHARWFVIAGCILGASPVVLGGEPQPAPEGFPRFIAPGYEKVMASLRSLYWLHYHTTGHAPNRCPRCGTNG